MTPDTDVTPVAAGSITLWDHEADVVIAGDDVAGAAAAVEAARSVASGVSLGDGSFYGRRAGRAAAEG
jgi:3-oxo-5alpha-steroid 4-dehydrogenase